MTPTSDTLGTPIFLTRQNRADIRLGATCDVADVRVWNLNTRSAHGVGWGQGPTVRAAASRIRLSVADSTTGPWTDLGDFQFTIHGDRPDAGDLLPIGRRVATSRFDLRILTAAAEISAWQRSRSTEYDPDLP